MEKKPHPLKGRKQPRDIVAKRARKCEPGCTCGRHNPRRTKEGLQRRREAIAREKSKGTYKKAAQKTKETRANWSDERKALDTKRRSEARKKLWAEGVYDDRRPATRRRVSRHEYALAPYLEKLGYRHNDDGYTFIAKKVPDFVDIEGRRVFEYFGTFWHQDRSEELEIKQFYNSKGWKCTVLWEDDLFEFLEENDHLVTEEQRRFAWKAAAVNYGYRPVPEERKYVSDIIVGEENG